MEVIARSRSFVPLRQLIPVDPGIGEGGMIGWVYGAHIQLKEGIRNLQHQNVGVVVLVADQDALAGSAHAMFHVVLFQSLQTGEHRGVFFRLMLFGTESVVAQREEAYSRRLIGVERFRDDGSGCSVCY